MFQQAQAVMRDPNNGAIAFFRMHAIQNMAKTAEMGRPIFDDIEVCEIRTPGHKDVKVFPATGFTMWVDDMVTGGQVPLTYAERFSHQYRQFKQSQHQTTEGTPLQYLPFLTEARRAELRALNVYTCEQLADLDGAELKNLGLGGRDLKHKAIDWLESARKNEPNLALANEIEALRLKNEVLVADLTALRERLNDKEVGDKSPAPPAPVEVHPDTSRHPLDAQFDDMTTDQIRQLVAERTGQAPVGAVPRKTLVRMAREAGVTA